MKKRITGVMIYPMLDYYIIVVSRNIANGTPQSEERHTYRYTYTFGIENAVRRAVSLFTGIQIYTVKSRIYQHLQENRVNDIEIN